MIRIISLGLILFGSVINAQPSSNTEVYVFDIITSNSKFTLSGFKNVSNDSGYDSQPSFYGDNILLYAGNNQGQTDIISYNLTTEEKHVVNREITPGGEYSPQRIPLSKSIAAVRLDPDGLQRLYNYDPLTGKNEILIEDLQIAYFAFYDQYKLLSSVLSNDMLDLVISDLMTKTNDTLLKNSGRSIHKAFGHNMSYTMINENTNQEIYLLKMSDRKSTFLCELPSGVQDYAWLSKTNLVIGSGSHLYQYDITNNDGWQKLVSLEEYQISNISRLTISNDGSKLALVAEPQ